MRSTSVSCVYIQINEQTGFGSLSLPTADAETDLTFLRSPFPDVEYARCKKQRLATGLLEQVTAAGVSYRLPTERPSRGIPH